MIRNLVRTFIGKIEGKKVAHIKAIPFSETYLGIVNLARPWPPRKVANRAWDSDYLMVGCPVFIQKSDRFS